MSYDGNQTYHNTKFMDAIHKGNKDSFDQILKTSGEFLDMEHALTTAIKSNLSYMVDKLIAFGSNFYAKNGNYYLKVAIANGHPPTIKTVFARVDDLNLNKKDAMIELVRKCDSDTLRYCLNLYQLNNYDFQSMLNIAVRRGDQSLTELLIGYIHQPDTSKLALSSAVRFGHIRITNTLLGAFDFPQEELDRALKIACECGHLDLFNLLKSKGADILCLTESTFREMIIKEHYALFDYLLSAGISYTPQQLLEHAVYFDDRQCAQILFNHGAVADMELNLTAEMKDFFTAWQQKERLTKISRKVSPSYNSELVL